MILRPARPDDLDAIHQLVRRVEVADGIPIITPRMVQHQLEVR